MAAAAQSWQTEYTGTIAASGHARQHNGNVVNNTQYYYSIRKRRSDETLRETQRSDVLLRASGEGQTPRVNYLIRLGVDLDHSDGHGLTALHHAAFSGFEDVVDALIAAGADVNAQSLDCGTPLHIAALKGRANVVDTLLRSRARPNASSRLLGSPLHCAVSSGYRGIINTFLRYPDVMECKIILPDLAYHIYHDKSTALDMNLSRFYGTQGTRKLHLLQYPPIGLVVQPTGNLEVFEALLDHDPGTMYASYSSWSPRPLHSLEFANAEWTASLLVLASSSNREDMIHMLLARGADPNHQGRHGRTALHDACIGGSLGCVKLLIDAGAYIDIADCYDRTPVTIAATLGRTEILQYMESSATNSAALRGVPTLSGIQDHIAIISANGQVAGNITPLPDKTTHFIPEGGSPITVSTKGKKATKDGHSRHLRGKSSQTSLLIEYFEASKTGDKSHSRPSVRVRVSPSSAKNSKGGNIEINGIGSDRKPSYTRRISLGNSSKNIDVGTLLAPAEGTP